MLTTFQGWNQYYQLEPDTLCKYSVSHASCSRAGNVSQAELLAPFKSPLSGQHVQFFLCWNMILVVLRFADLIISSQFA